MIFPSFFVFWSCVMCIIFLLDWLPIQDFIVIGLVLTFLNTHCNGGPITAYRKLFFCWSRWCSRYSVNRLAACKASDSADSNKYLSDICIKLLLMTDNYPKNQNRCRKWIEDWNSSARLEFCSFWQFSYSDSSCWWTYLPVIRWGVEY